MNEGREKHSDSAFHKAVLQLNLQSFVGIPKWGENLYLDASISVPGDLGAFWESNWHSVGKKNVTFAVTVNCLLY